MATFIQLLVAGIAIGLIYALCALGVNIIYKSTKILLLAGGGLVLMPAYIAWVFVSWEAFPPALAIIVTFLLSAVLGWVLYRTTQHPLIGQPLLAPAICTTMLWFLLRGVTFLIWGGNPRMFPSWLAGRDVLHFGPVNIPEVTVVALVACALVVAVLMLYFKYSRGGLAMRVTAESHTIAEILGIKVRRVFGNAWVICLLLFAVAGILTGAITGISQDLDMIGVYGIVVALLGGLESFTGAIVGGLLIGLAQTLVGGYLGAKLGGGIAEVVPFIIIWLVMYWRPYGLWGLVRIERI
ncbi:MAG: branched-chain amino acid ABC transporter permease [Chloroflexota bacterium]